MLDPRRLRLLVLLESVGTVRGVARAASLSPSAVSQQLAVLEQEAGTALLRRSGRRVVLTDAGLTLVEHARVILDRLHVAQDDLRALREQPAGVVTVAGFTSAMQGFVLPAAAAVRRAHPAIRVQLSELGPAACLAAVQRGDADLALVGDLGEGAPPATGGLQAVALTADALHAVVAPGHPVLAGEAVALAALRDEDWLLDGAEYEAFLLRACRREGFEPRVVARLVSHEALVRGVAVGLGVTVLPTLALHGATGVEHRPMDPAVPRALSALHRPDGLDRRAVAVTLDALVTSAAAV